jgi:hypothetical protein
MIERALDALLEEQNKHALIGAGKVRRRLGRAAGALSSRGAFGLSGK